MARKKVTRRSIRNRNPMTVVLFIGISVTLCILIVFYTARNNERQNLLTKIEILSKDVGVVYDNLITFQDGVVEQRYYRKECTERAISFGNGPIQCGVSGVYRTNKTNNVSGILSQKIEDIGNNKSQVFLHPETNKTINGFSVTIAHVISGTVCSILYNYYDDTASSDFMIKCMVSSSDFLPGYAVTK